MITKRYYSENKEKLLAKQNKYNIENKEYIKTRAAIHYQKNKISILEKSKLYVFNNKERTNLRLKKYRENNLEKVKDGIKNAIAKNPDKYKSKNREYQKMKRSSDALFALKGRISAGIRAAFNKKSYSKKSRTHSILGCSYEFFLNHISSQFTEGMTIDKLGSEIQLDHIQPISSATTEEEVIRLNHWSNFQPLWAKDNLAKSDTMPPQETIDIVNMIYECSKCVP
jgi:hypothetical protein